MAFGAASLFGNQNNFATYLTLTLPYFAGAAGRLPRRPPARRRVRRRAGPPGGCCSTPAARATCSRPRPRRAPRAARHRPAGARAPRGGGRVAASRSPWWCPSVLGGGRRQARRSGRVRSSTSAILARQIGPGEGSGGVRGALLERRRSRPRRRDQRGPRRRAPGTRRRASGPCRLPRVANLHNWWLEVLVNGGLVGFACWIAFFLILLRGCLRAARRGRRDRSCATWRSRARSRCSAASPAASGPPRPSTSRPCGSPSASPHAAVADAGHRERDRAVRVLILSHMYPSPVNVTAGIFVHEQALALVAPRPRRAGGVAARAGRPRWLPRWRITAGCPALAA